MDTIGNCFDKCVGRQFRGLPGHRAAEPVELRHPHQFDAAVLRAQRKLLQLERAAIHVGSSVPPTTKPAPDWAAHDHRSIANASTRTVRERDADPTRLRCTRRR